MIRYLRVENFGIIRSAQLEFEPGFNVITGESGSGKSLIARAIAAACGARVSKDLVHADARFARVEAVFELPSGIDELLEELGIEGSRELIVRRIISREGKNRIFVNDTLVSLKTLQQLFSGRVEIQGQRESIKLLDSDYQLLLLDAFGGLEPLREKYALLYGEYLEAKRRLEELKQREQEVIRERDYLEYVVSEIESAEISPQEEEELLKERELLSNYSALSELAGMACSLLEDGEVNASSLVVQVMREAERLAGRVPGIDEAVERLSSALEGMEEALGIIKGIASGIDYSPERIDYIQERLELYSRLKKKYGPTVGDVLSFLETSKERLSRLEGMDFEREKLERELDELHRRLEEFSLELSHKRQRLIRTFEGEVVSALKELGFPAPAFEVALSEGELGRWGRDRVEFMFSANPDLPVAPLKRVASGGELSRVLLALRVVASDEETELFLFDEIDAGIGGEVAHRVGEALRRLGDKKQVIAVTHFPQIASLASRHLKVEKVLKEGKTFVRVSLMEGESRKRELERMVGGIVKDGEDR